MPLPNFKVLCLGCYGTLIDADTGLAAALKPLATAAGVAGNRDELVASFARHQQAQRDAGLAASHGAELMAAHRALAHEWGVICSEHDHALFANSIAHWPPHAEATGALQYLRRYFRLVAVTNADRASVEASARRLDIRFDAVVTAWDAGAYRPAPAFFAHLADRLAKLGAAPRQALHVGRTVDDDCAPAAAAGFRVAWLDRSRSRAAAPAECDFVFHSLTDVVRTHHDQLRG